MTVANVMLWGDRIGVVTWADQMFATFEYDPNFTLAGLEVSPIHMPLRAGTYEFPGLANESFEGLPGLLRDSLPDRFGKTIIEQYLAQTSRTGQHLDPVEKLCYTGSRGMGALEFLPSEGPTPIFDQRLDVGALASLASQVLIKHKSFRSSFASGEIDLSQLLVVGTSAGGARAKALVAWNPETNEVRSSQGSADGFDHWLLKFSTVSANADKEATDEPDYGLIEFAYYHMATAAGIHMAECRLLKDGSAQHFITRRFDRPSAGAKLHMQSFGAIDHQDLENAGATSYERLGEVTRLLGLGIDSVEQQFRRMAFNVFARNQDDHVKNFAFLMNPSGEWSVSPAFDVTYSYNPRGAWTGQHQMSINGKLDHFHRDDLHTSGKTMGIRPARVRTLIEEVATAVDRWAQFAASAGLPEEVSHRIALAHRSESPAGDITAVSGR